jgi:hypothetical protein
MFCRPALLAALLLAPLPAVASDFALTVQNNSSHVITAVSAFGVDKTGTPVEDNLGGLIDDVPVGASAAFDLSISACQRVAIYVTLDDATELNTLFDTCANQTLILTD